MKKCPDCGTKNMSHREYCIRCACKLTKSHRPYHLTRDNSSRFVLDHLVSAQ